MNFWTSRLQLLNKFCFNYIYQIWLQEITNSVTQHIQCKKTPCTTSPHKKNQPNAKKPNLSIEVNTT